MSPKKHVGLKGQMIRALWLGLGLVGLQPVAAQTQWTSEELIEHLQGFNTGETAAILHNVSKLIHEGKPGFSAMCEMLHGNHGAYLLRIEKLLDELDNPRFQVREQAQRDLVEEGARAMALIRELADSAATVEERIRASEILAEISQRGTEKEETEARHLRGLALTALHWERQPELSRALVSALQHTDPQLVSECIRALGTHGDDEIAATLIRLTETLGASQRTDIRTALAEMPGERGRDHILDLLLAGTVGETEAVQLVRVLSERPDRAAAMERLLAAEDDLVIATAKTSLPPNPGDAPKVRIWLADRAQSRIEGRFLGYAGASIRLGEPTIIRGNDREDIAMPEMSFLLRRCDRIEFVDSPPAPPTADCRLFLVQGSLVTGELIMVRGDKVVLESKTFGRMEVDRSAVQGLALDPTLDRLLGSSQTLDKVRLKDNKILAGQILELNGGALSMIDEDGAGQTIPESDIAGILFQRPLQMSQSGNTFTRVSLANGDKVLGHIAAVTSSHIGVVTPGVGTAVVETSDVLTLELGLGGGAMWGFTLVADYSENRVVEFDDRGREVFSIDDIIGVWDVECLDNGNLLITEFSLNRVFEVTRDKKTVWSFDDLKNPYDADRLPNGNTLIADTFGRRVIEVDKAGRIVWSFDNDIHPYDADRLPNGNTLIADVLDDRVIEVDPEGRIVWQIKNVPHVHDADRLPNGNTLLTIRMLHEVREVDPTGKTVLTLKNLSSPSDADRLPNGNTLVAENQFIREFDRHGNEVWRLSVTWAVEVNRY